MSLSVNSISMNKWFTIAVNIIFKSVYNRSLRKKTLMIDNVILVNNFRLLIHQECNTNSET